MGHKVNPNGFRYGITKERQANWYADKKHFADFLLEDSKIRKYFESLVRKFMIGKIDISRDEGSKNITVTIQSARPGAILGQNGDDLKTLTKDLKKAIKNRKSELNINIITIEKPELNARLVAEQIAMQLENRGSFRAAQKTAIRNTMKAGAKGIKTSVSGRLNGADMARSEGYTEGTMSLHTLRQDIEFATATARTTYGAIGIKVWISRGEILDNGNNVKEGDE